LIVSSAVKKVGGVIWLVSFTRQDLGLVDLRQKTSQPLDNPFDPRLLPMSRDETLPMSPGCAKTGW
jgi:hypothetical protein